MDPGVDDAELLPGSVEPAAYCTSLAFLKAKAGSERLPEHTRSHARVIGADTICLHQGEIIGKPRDEQDARATIERFMNDRHEVLTGVAILEGPSRELLVDRATVHVGSIKPAQLDAYLASGAWRGKAGAYNLFERLDSGWPIEFNGDPTTIIGLPMVILTERLGLTPPTQPLRQIGGAA